MNHEDALKVVQKLKTKSVSVNGGELIVREMTADEYVSFFEAGEKQVEDGDADLTVEQKRQRVVDGIKMGIDEMVNLFIGHVVDGDGKPLFTADDKPALKKSSRAALRAVQTAVFELSGITFRTTEEQDDDADGDDEPGMSVPEKNFDKVPSEFSHTASH